MIECIVCCAVMCCVWATLWRHTGFGIMLNVMRRFIYNSFSPPVENRRNKERGEYDRIGWNNSLCSRQLIVRPPTQTHMYRERKLGKTKYKIFNENYRHNSSVNYCLYEGSYIIIFEQSLPFRISLIFLLKQSYIFFFSLTFDKSTRKKTKVWIPSGSCNCRQCVDIW